MSRRTTEGGVRGLDVTGAPPASAAGRLGRGITVKGVLRGKEDLVVEGSVEGSIALPEHHLVLDRPSRTRAEVSGKNVTLRGRHRGNAGASDRLEISASSVVIGDLRAPRLVVREGAKLRGMVQMDVRVPADLDVPRSSSSSSTAAAPAAAAPTADTATPSTSGDVKKKGRPA